jgi:uncharacterized membrane protein HdeD (DUF308 family)
MLRRDCRRQASASRPVLAVICILFGILLLVFPDLVGIIIGVFLLVQGILLLIDYYDSNRRRQRTYTPSPPPPSAES